MPYAIGEHQNSDLETTVTPARVVSKTASYTPVLADANRIVEVSSSSSTTLTVPPDSSVAFPVGTVLGVYQLGLGTVTVTAGTGVTVESSTASTSSRSLTGQYAEASLRKRAANTWVLAGDLT
jgi:hypothetical protein